MKAMKSMMDTDVMQTETLKAGHELPPLPYAVTALEPHISKETLKYHHGKHHLAYVGKLNELIVGTEFERLSLETIVKSAKGPIFNNAAQVWNHTFYWCSLAPDGGGEPAGELAQTLNETFGSVAKFKAAFSAAAIGAFGSGWAWLVAEPDGSLAIRTTSNAQTPLTVGAKPLLTCDVWEHAYYIDHRNSRPKYLEAFWAVVNWKFAARNFQH
jgi:Fe-Mn family superoxide dismutase